MLKALEAGADPYLGFLDFRNTATEGLGTSPAQRLFGRRPKTLEFDTTSQLLHVQIVAKRHVLSLRIIARIIDLFRNV